MTARWQEQVSLKPYNTFGIDVKARYFTQARNDDELREALSQARQRGVAVLVMGGGSNLLLTRDVDALVLHVASRGRRVLSDDAGRVVVEAEAGEPWHPFVQWSLQQGFCGLENLSLIPGTVGAAPMQNVGAYGVEIKDVFAGLTALDRETGELRDFSLEDCAFGYRDSLFKRNPGRWLILRVRFALSHSLQAIWTTARCVSAWPNRACRRRLRRPSAMPSAVFAVRSCQTRPSWVMPGAFSRTRWCPLNGWCAFARRIQGWWRIRRVMAGRSWRQAG